MFKKALFKALSPIVCMLAVAFAPIGVSADQYYNNNCCATNDCCQEDPCCNKNGWFKDAAIFVGAAAVGAVAGVIAGNSSSKRGRTGDTGATGAGLTPAVVPPGQPGAGDLVTSLTFTFDTLVTVSLVGSVTPYVTTPDGQIVFGAPFTPIAITGTSTVTLSGFPLYFGQYNVGILASSGLVAAAGVVTVELTDINGTPVSPSFAEVPIPVAAGILGADTLFSAQFPFAESP